MTEAVDQDMIDIAARYLRTQGMGIVVVGRWDFHVLAWDGDTLVAADVQGVKTATLSDRRRQALNRLLRSWSSDHGVVDGATRIDLITVTKQLAGIVIEHKRGA